LKGFSGDGYHIDFHPGGRMLGVPLADGTAVLLDLDDGARTVLRGHRDEVNYLRFGPKGQRVATTSDDHTVRVWDVASGRPLWRCPVMSGDPPEIYTPSGWKRLDGSAKPAAGSRAWRRAVERRGAPGSDAGPRTLCLRTFDETLEIWDRARDRRGATQRLPGLSQTVAAASGCLALVGQEARLYDLKGAFSPLASGVRALSADSESLYLITGERVLVHDRAGKRRAEHRVPPGCTAATRAGEWLVLGFKGGEVRLLPWTPGGKARAAVSFTSLPTSAVTRIIPGHPGTVAIGFASGLLGIWHLKRGRLLDSTRLHGPVVHLKRYGQTIHAASELGDHRSLDLQDYRRDYCELLRELWTRVPQVWHDGRVQLLPPPERHRCRKK
jgi:WD40 repeat protein